MNKSSDRALNRCILFAGVTIVMMFPCRASAQPASVDVHFGANAEFVLHEPIVVRVRFDNNRDEPIQIDLGLDGRNAFRVGIQESDGVSIRVDRKRTECMECGVVAPVTVPPRQSYTQALILNEWYGFGDAGEYAVDIDLKAQIGVGATINGMAVPPLRIHGAEVFDIPARLRFTVAPFDGHKLRDVCSTLTSTLTTSLSAVASGDAARAMSYINDPVAVPCILSAIRVSPTAANILIPGLERIGSPEARDALTQLSRSPDRETATLAATSMNRLRRR